MAADPATDAHTSAAPPAVSPSPLVVGDSHCHSGRVFQCPYLAVVLRRWTLVRIAGVCGCLLEDPRTAVGGLRRRRCGYLSVCLRHVPDSLAHGVYGGPARPD